MPTPDPESLFLMGRCGRAHGVRGEVKVVPETDDPARFGLLERVYIGEGPETALERTVELVRLQPQKGRVTVLLKLTEITTREAAEALRGQAVYADEEALPPLEDGEVYLHDLIGLDVVEADEDGEPADTPLGTVRDTLESGAHLLLVIAREGRPDVLLPDVPDFVLDVDLEARRILVRPPDGLFEE